MNRLERLFAITEVVRQSSPRPVSASRLAERFEVSRRTIERDLASLREAGAPFISEPGRTGGTVSLDAAAGAVVSLTSPQVTALLIAVSVAGPDMPFSTDAQAGGDALLRGLAENTRSRVQDLRGRIRSPHQPPAVKARVRQSVEAAVRNQVAVNITYTDANGTETERTVDAHGFYLGADGWHLNGWCHLRDAGRVFRLDRMQSVRVTRKQVKPRNVDEVLGWVPTHVTPV